MTYKTTIGLEVHAELNTKSKMFCGCKNEPHGVEPNTHICPVCMAHPGTLPVPNEKAIEMVLLFGRSVGAKSADFSEFDRKNYFYPDIPKAYQISQYAFPFLTGGQLEGIELTRVHLEEDTARSQHDKGKGSVVDFNRAGVPLMELVTEPVIHDAETAGTFARELQLLLRTIGISHANMEKGEMRVEANISVSKDKNFGTKVEVKNLNSFKSVEAAIKYEVERQVTALDNNEKIVQETRGWDEVKLKTYSQRTKETAKDYRYFPDPDLPKMDVTEHAPFKDSRLDEILPILPNETRELYKNLGIKSNTVDVLMSDSRLDLYFKSLLKLTDDEDIAKLSANYLTSDILPLLAENRYKLSELKETHFTELMLMLKESKIGSRVAKDLIKDLFSSKQSPLEIATEKNLLQLSDTSSLGPIIAEVIKENEAVVAEYKEGKEASMKYLVGQGMKKSRGSANPTLLKEMLEEAIK